MSAAACPRCERTAATDARFCSQCGAALAGPSPEAGPGPARPYTPEHLARKILRSKSALAGERKQVTVLFVDVRRSMQLAERVDPEEWHRIMDRFFAVVADGIHRFEGTINQYTGDGVMALFGAPVAHEDHAQRACHAALALREQLRLFAQELRRTRGLAFGVRMGLDSGAVVVGAIGDDLRMDYTAQGHTVGLAARMQELAEAGEVYLSGGTAELVSGFFELRSVGRFRVKGVREAVRTFALVGTRPIRTRLEAARARGFSALVGRADELALLDGAFSRAVAGHGQVVGVVGDPGLGKSRLCREAVERFRAEGVAVAEAHCPAHGRSLPFGAVADLVRDFLGVAPGERPAAARRRVRARLRRLHRSLEAELPLALDLLGLTDPRRPPAPEDEQTRRQRLAVFVRRLVQARSALEASVLLVDDAHRIDPESEALLGEIVDALGWTRTLLLVNFRPEYTADWMRASYYQALPLAPLARDAADALLAELVGGGPALASLAASVAERAEGNPLFIEEIVRGLFDQGVLGRGRQGVRLAQPAGGFRIPDTVQAVLAARIDRLPEAAKQALQTAAVIGKRFGEPVLRALLGPEADLAGSLRTLERAGLLERPAPGEVRFAFKHSLTHEVAYLSQLKEARQRVHEQVARALEAVHADRLGEHAAELAHHWDAAGRGYEARQWRRRAALRVTNIQLGRGARREPRRRRDRV